MVDIGHLKVLNCSGDLDDGRLMSVRSLRVWCKACALVSDKLPEQDQAPSSGTVIVCGHCGTRQVVSNASLVRRDGSVPRQSETFAGGPYAPVPDDDLRAL